MSQKGSQRSDCGPHLVFGWTTICACAPIVDNLESNRTTTFVGHLVGTFWLTGRHILGWRVDTFWGGESTHFGGKSTHFGRHIFGLRVKKTVLWEIQVDRFWSTDFGRHSLVDTFWSTQSTHFVSWSTHYLLRVTACQSDGG